MLSPIEPKNLKEDLLPSILQDSVASSISLDTSRTIQVQTLSSFDLGDTTVEYRIDSITGLIGLRVWPTCLKHKVLERREQLLDFEYKKAHSKVRVPRASTVDSIIQAKCVGDDYPTGFSQGLSLRNSATSLGLRYQGQEVSKNGLITTIKTVLVDEKGRFAEHRAQWREGESVLEVETVFRNESLVPVSLELLSSFSIGDITPFHSADAPNRLQIHRFRSAWSAEGRLETRTVEELNLERSWQDHAVRCERFGQVGSLPVKGFFPLAVVEDTEAGVCWGAQLAWAGSWQMEFYRQGDALCLSGGLADREFGHWLKTLHPGEHFRTPKATIACVWGNLDSLCHRLTAAHQAAADNHPEQDSDLPIVCNEYCSSWGNPTHDNLEKLAKRLQGSPVRYLVIDAGWYGALESEWWSQQGEWQSSAERFPTGLRATAQMIRAYGLVPGLWFEMEVAGRDSATFSLNHHQLKREGIPITTTKRHFWDFRDPWVREYLADRVIGTLKEAGFGYAKFDYNETIGIGVDGAESLGEGLRQHIEGVTDFFDEIRKQLPDLVIENCSSGGHRLEPSMIARSAMSSFSDAHESLEIPIIAANLHRVMLPRQSQIWAVLHSEDEERRMIYSLSATFLGRMCLSGNLAQLSADQWTLVNKAMNLYTSAAHLIKLGRSFRFGPNVTSYRYPTGWQTILRISEQESQALVVAHSFADFDIRDISIPLPAGGEWCITSSLHCNESVVWVHDGILHIRLGNSFDATVILLDRKLQ